MNLEAALTFIGNQGDIVEQARLNYLLNGRSPSFKAVSGLLAGQRPDGGWAAFWAPDYSSLDATCFRLAQAEQIGLMDSHTAITEAALFLSQRQQSDGSWEEDESVASVAPPWAKPGDLASRLYLTANCGFWLVALTGASEASLSAANHLRTHLDGAGRLPASWQAHWLAGGLWYRLNWQQPAEQALTCLDSQLSNLPTSNLAWLGTTLLVAGVPPTHPLVERAASILEDCQTQDGHWQSEDGPEWDVHTTIEALRVLRFCGRF